MHSRNTKGCINAKDRINTISLLTAHRLSQLKIYRLVPKLSLLTLTCLISIFILTACGGGASASVTDIDIASHLQIDFNGTNGRGAATVGLISESAFERELVSAAGLDDARDGAASASDEIDVITGYVRLMSAIDWSIMPTTDLSNGDTVTLTIRANSNTLDEFNIRAAGGLLHTFIVEGLPEGQVLDIFQDIEVEVAGISPFLMINIIGHSEYEEFSGRVGYYVNGERGFNREPFSQMQEMGLSSIIRNAIRDGNTTFYAGQVITIAAGEGHVTVAERLGYELLSLETQYTLPHDAPRYVSSFDELGDGLTEVIEAASVFLENHLMSRDGRPFLGGMSLNLMEIQNRDTYSLPLQDVSSYFNFDFAPHSAYMLSVNHGQRFVLNLLEWRDSSITILFEVHAHAERVDGFNRLFVSRDIVYIPVVVPGVFIENGQVQFDSSDIYLFNVHMSNFIEDNTFPWMPDYIHRWFMDSAFTESYGREHMFFPAPQISLLDSAPDDGMAADEDAGEETETEEE